MQGKGYSTAWLEELKGKSNIVDVVSKYVRLEQKGRKFWGCCPFHSEKTPSFVVDEAEGYYHCFGCKEGGDVINFVEKMESCNFYEAVEILANDAKMDIPQISIADESIIKRKKERERCFKILDAAYKFYEKNLYLPSAKKAQDYIKFRGFTRNELEDFKIGYSNSWTSLIDHLKKEGFSIEDMLLAGLVAKNDAKSNYYDVMGERLIFPIFNILNECVGFSGRMLEKTDFAKYKNTAETPVFQKNKLVFGINLLKKQKQAGNLKDIILVEGQVDVIAMHRAGFKSTVACLGTALTENHAKELKKLCDNVVICFDGDGAGIKAAVRGIDILRNAGFNVKVVALPEGADPDEVLKNEGKEKLASYIDNAMSIMDYLIMIESKKFDLKQPEEKGKFVKAVLAHLSKLETSSSREPYLEKIRDMTNIPIDILRRDMFGGEILPKTKEKEEVLIVRENGNIKAVKFVLAAILHKKDYVDKKLNYKRLMPSKAYVLDLIAQNKSISAIFDDFDVEADPLVKDIIFFNFDEFKDIEEKYFEECVWSLAEEILKERQTQLSMKFSQASDLTERRSVMAQMQDVMKKIRAKNLEDFYD